MFSDNENLYITYRNLNQLILKDITNNKIISENKLDDKFEFQIDVDTNQFIQNYISKKYFIDLSLNKEIKLSDNKNYIVVKLK